MKLWHFGGILPIGFLALAACAAQEKALPVEGPEPAAPAPAAPAAKPAWEQEWERVLAAAKQEGKVVVAGPTGPVMRKVLAEAFEQRYGITVEYMGTRGPETTARLRTERGAGQYLWDVFITGTTHLLNVKKELGALDPIGPALILPEVADPRNWREGRLEFGDKDRLYLIFTPYTRSSLFVNPNLVKPEQLTSWRALLDPRWKGKILMHDPRIGGSGQSVMMFFHQHPALGPDYIRALARQELTFLRDYIQEMQWLGQGKFPILTGSGEGAATPLIEQGVPIAIVDPRQLKEGGGAGSGSGNVGLINRAPHPNAAKVYINWLLSREAQTEFSKARGFPSWRVDVPTDHLAPWMRVPKQGDIASHTEEALELRDRVIVPFMREVFGR